MKKVLIITFCHRDWLVNYGQTLQAFALFKTIERLGYDVTVASHKIRSEEEKNYYIEKFDNPRYDSIEDRTFSKFSDFVKKYMGNHCLQTYSENEICRLAQMSDILVCGSDAIWRTMHYDPAYYLHLEGCGRKLKISYAASFVNFIGKDIDVYKKMGNMIRNIHYISTRETPGAEILKSVCGCPETETVLDPTVLLGAENWKKYMLEVETNKPYVLLYLIDDSDIYDEWIEIIKKRYGAVEAYSLFVLTEIRPKNRRYIADGVSPDEYISLVNGARAVITNSFHGTLFSLMFHKEVYIFKRYNPSLEGDFRFEYIAEMCGIKDRLICSTESIHNILDINWDYIDGRLEKERKKSMSFLEGALKDKDKKLMES